MCGVLVNCMFLCNNIGPIVSHIMQHFQAHSTQFSSWIGLHLVSSNISFLWRHLERYNFEFEWSEAAIGGVLQEKMILEISKISEENICVGASF